MKKVIYFVLILLVACSTAAFASPLPDTSLGEVALDLSLGGPKLSTDDQSSKGKQEIGYGVTAGVGFGFAGHYSYNDFKAKTPLHGSSDIKVQQFYLVNNLISTVVHVAVFGGLSKTEADGGSERNGIVAGVAGDVPIAPNTRAYGVLSAGSRVSGYEVGLSYKLTSYTTFNLGYQDTKYKGITFGDTSKSDVTAKGLVGGVTLKF